MKQSVDVLESVLDAERNALFQADYESLTRIAVSKERIEADGLHLSDASHEDLDRVARKFAQNQSLLNASLSGLRQAAKLLADHRRNQRCISVYNHVGVTQTISSPARATLEKKA